MLSRFSGNTTVVMFVFSRNTPELMLCTVYPSIVFGITTVLSFPVYPVILIYRPFITLYVNLDASVSVNSSYIFVAVALGNDTLAYSTVVSTVSFAISYKGW